MGAMVGSLLEYSALLIGYPALLLNVFSLYALAFVTTPRGASAGQRSAG